MSFLMGSGAGGGSGGFLSSNTGQFLQGYAGLKNDTDYSKAGAAWAKQGQDSQNKANEWQKYSVPLHLSRKSGPQISSLGGGGGSIYGAFGQPTTIENPLAKAWSNIMAQSAADRARNLQANLAMFRAAPPISYRPTWQGMV